MDANRSFSYPENWFCLLKLAINKLKCLLQVTLGWSDRRAAANFPSAISVTPLLPLRFEDYAEFSRALWPKFLCRGAAEAAPIGKRRNSSL